MRVFYYPTSAQTLFIGAIFILQSLITVTECTTGGSDRVRLTDITALTLRKGQYTVGRRSSPIAQLECVGGTAKCRYEPRVVQCYNRGYDGVDVQWECQAEMSEEYVFGKIEVSCEGYSYPEDPFILKGSCGLKYEVDYADSAHGKKQPSAPPLEGESSGTGIFFWLLAAVIIGMFLFALIPSSASRSGPTNGPSTGMGPGPGPGPGPGGPGGPGPGYGWAGGAAPGASPRAPGSFKSGVPPPSYDEACGGPSTRQQQPGFFTGLGLGGIAGYMFGQTQNSPRRRNQFEQDTGFFSGPSTSTSTRQRSSSPVRRRTTGFGGTSRR